MEHTDRTANECYQYNTETRAQLTKLEERHDKLAERVFDKLETLDASLMTRLPIWATMFIWLLGLMVGGWLAKVVIR